MDTSFFVILWHHIPGYLLAAAHFFAAIWASYYVIMHKRDSRATVTWLGIIWFSPVVGPAFYYVFGINRIERRIIALRRVSSQRTPYQKFPKGLVPPNSHTKPGIVTENTMAERMLPFGHNLIGFPLEQGHSLSCYADGPKAYEAMLASINAAQHYICLCIYIFNNDAVGRQFLQALAAAQSRGVKVYVLVDKTGARYSFPTIFRAAKKLGLTFIPFAPFGWPERIAAINLRNHRKLLIIDGSSAFTGGMNISAKNLPDARGPGQHDLQVKIQGPVIQQFIALFAEDWAFSSRTPLPVLEVHPKVASSATTMCLRAIPDGPDLDVEKVALYFQAAIQAARHQITIVTPYFVPDPSLWQALRVAALMNIKVTLILPEHSNIPPIDWASRAYLPSLISAGVKVHLQTGSFDHTKLMLVDDAWFMLGSANWDDRSLRLNFELNVEGYDRAATQGFRELCQQKLANSRLLTSEDLTRRPLAVKLRDSVAKLFSPLL